MHSSRRQPDQFHPSIGRVGLAFDQPTFLEPVDQEGHVRWIAFKQAGQMAHGRGRISGVEMPEDVSKRLGEVQLSQEVGRPTAQRGGEGEGLLDEFNISGAGCADFADEGGATKSIF